MEKSGKQNFTTGYPSLIKKRYNWSRDRLKSFQFIKIYNKLLVLS